MIEFDPKDEGDAMAAGRGIFREFIETLQQERIKAYHAGMRDGVRLATAGLSTLNFDESQLDFYRRMIDG